MQVVASMDANSLPLFQQLTRGDPPHGDAVCALSAVAAAGRGSVVRAGGDICHETVRFWRNRLGRRFAAEIRKRPCPTPVLFATALAPGRGLREDQR